MEKDLNSKQCIRLEFLEDYHINIAYHPGNVNVKEDALSKRLVACEARLVVVAVLVRLTISPTIANCIK